MGYDLSTEGGRIGWARERAGFVSVREFAAALGMDTEAGRVQVSRWLSGARRPGREKARQIAKVLGVSEAWLTFGGPVPNGTDPSAGSGGYLQRELERLMRLEMDERVRAAQIAELAAVYRAAALRDEAEAALKRAAPAPADLSGLPPVAPATPARPRKTKRRRNHDG